MSAPSTKGLFQATKPKRDQRTGDLLASLPEQEKTGPRETRDPLDYDPTPWDATAAFLNAEGNRIREIGGPVFEPAAGGGHMAMEIKRAGFDVITSDIVDRGFPIDRVQSFYDWRERPCNIKITNPPYNEVSARDGHGRWLRHTFDLGFRYVAMLLNWDWMAARLNGMDGLHATFPVSRVYLCCWKIDFRGGGSPPQRNAWHVWDRDWRGETVVRRLFRELSQEQQGSFI